MMVIPVGVVAQELTELFVPGRQHRPPRPPVRTGHRARPRRPCAAGRDQAIQEAHGLGLPVGLVVRERLQRRLLCGGGETRDCPPAE
jgi:hypothetical protein